jgi:DNA-binding NarL/FixJ family response regulator
MQAIDGRSPTLSLHALLIDDHQIFREGLKGLLKAQAAVEDITEATTLAEGLAAIAIRTPDIITIDLDLPDVFGDGTVSRLRAAAPSARHIVVSATEDSATILAALAAGAHGYVPKRLAGTEAAHAVREVLAGRVFVPASVHAGGSSGPDKSRVLSELGRLSPRQLDVARGLATGSTTKVIAYDLNLSEGTVKLHLSAIYRILGCSNRAQAVGLLSRIDPRALTVAGR